MQGFSIYLENLVRLHQRFRQWAVLAVVGLLAASFILIDSQANAQEGAVFRVDRLSVVTGNDRHDFRVEIAETPSQRDQGLMWRRQMLPGTGMLFDFERTEPVVMWMKNTYIPLDMLFITAKGLIINIARDTTPHSTDFISSAGPVLSVLELPAGTVKTLGIRAGDRVEHPIFNK